jgi:hypothetical protein
MRQFPIGHVSRCNAKKMFTIVRNPTGFQVIRVLPSGCKLNSSYYQNEMFGPLSEWRSEQDGAASRRLIVHADKAGPPTAAAAASQKGMEENEMIRVPHPPSSSDLASSNYYLFGSVKRYVRDNRKTDFKCGLSRVDGKIRAM